MLTQNKQRPVAGEETQKEGLFRTDPHRAPPVMQVVSAQCGCSREGPGGGRAPRGMQHSRASWDR